MPRCARRPGRGSNRASTRSSPGSPAARTRTTATPSRASSSSTRRMRWPQCRRVQGLARRRRALAAGTGGPAPAERIARRPRPLRLRNRRHHRARPCLRKAPRPLGIRRDSVRGTHGVRRVHGGRRCRGPKGADVRQDSAKASPKDLPTPPNRALEAGPTRRSAQRPAARFVSDAGECHAQHQCNRAGATLRPAVEALS